ncbi:MULTISPECIES: YncE family protein [unclassified Frankia]|uniref:YncE family protein n=1 Tax=unclassified Frankia TaxID=2632575 RepID=UPI004043B471
MSITPRRRHRRSHGRLLPALVGLVIVLITATGLAVYHHPSSGPRPHTGTSAEASRSAAVPPTAGIYAHAGAGMFSPAVSGDPALVYVPNLRDGTLTVIDQNTMRVIATYRTGAEPQHVVPSWDLRTLWVNNNLGNSLTPIDPRTGQPAGPAIPVSDPYNLYFTPDGRYAMVMAEAIHHVDFRDPHSFALRHSLDVGTRCAGVNHADFSPDGSYAIATCEFAGRLVKIDIAAQRVVGYLDLGPHAAPQDIRIEPAGKIWYVADMNADGVHLIDGDSFTTIGFVETGPETHGLYPSRNDRYLYVTNRGGHLMSDMPPFPHDGSAGSVSVIDFATRKVVVTWPIPGGGTPDMGNINADGSRLWLSGRRSNVVYVFDTGGTDGDDPARGRMLSRIPVGREPHGLAVWPQPGRYSLGHTGILR